MPDLPVPPPDEPPAGTSRGRAGGQEQQQQLHRSSVWDPLRKIGSWLRREDDRRDEDYGFEHEKRGNGEEEQPLQQTGLLHRRTGSRKAVPGLPRPLTFKRMNSEKRDRLLPVPVEGSPRRAISRPAAPTRNLSPPPLSVPSLSAPDVLSPNNSDPAPTIGGAFDSNIPAGARQVDYAMEESVSPPSLQLGITDSYSEHASQRSASEIDELRLQEELEAKWILNLSMHFRDRSDREKFFVTYAEEPTRWRRVTVSCDYRELTADSLEADLKSLHYQRDKSARIYEAIRDSLPDIQFYATVTNLKLQTADGRLHVHVTEDVNEIIPYPSLSAVDHLSCKRVKESAVSFDSHISGFVYKVSVNNKIFIKKEIPGPDAVEEFLYEINALSTLQDSKSVIQFEGIIVDEQNELIKGLLISYADQGALVDVIYDFRNSDYLSWGRRERWARQIVEGLSEIHEAGFVQGDFTLSNIVVDRHENAKIIDINRRGCPVGWEPPELARLIESGQRISIYIGVKSDIFQLGMVLWALAEQHDEPERQERPLYRSYENHNSTPDYFRDIVKACLSDNPRGRPAAKDILARFPDSFPEQPKTMGAVRLSISTHRSDKEYIDPATAVDLEDIPKHNHHRSRSSFSNIHMPSTEYIGSSGSYILPNHARGRTPVHRSSSQNRRSEYSPYPGPHSIMSLDDSELDNELASLPASRGTRWEQVYVDGDTKLVQRHGVEIDAHDFTAQEPKDVCITTPPGELSNSYFDTTKPIDTPPNVSGSAGLPPFLSPLPPSVGLETGVSHDRQPSNKASFSERIHHANPIGGHIITDSLADLENEMALDASVDACAAPSRVGTGFSEVFRLPLHTDSGFNEPESRVSFENERIRHNLDASRLDLQHMHEETIIEECLWDEGKRTMIADNVQEEVHTSHYNTVIAVPKELMDEKAVEEKVSSTTIRPPSLTIPQFHHGVPQPADLNLVETSVDEAQKEHHEELQKHTNHVPRYHIRHGPHQTSQRPHIPF